MRSLLLVVLLALGLSGCNSGHKVGDHLMVEWKGKYYPATVQQVVGKDQYFIHYDGYENSWDETVGPSRIADDGKAPR